MKNKNQTKTVFILVCFFVLTTFIIAFNSTAHPDTITFGCHPDPTGYTITADVSEIHGEASSEQIVEIIATGTNVVVDVYAGALDNDEFTISPSNTVSDNDVNDLDAAVGSIRVILTITLPSTPGIYTLRILSREPTLSGDSTTLKELDIEVTVGTVTPTLFEIIFDHNGILIGASIVILACVGGIVFQINLKKRKESKFHGFLIGIALLLASVNMFLAMNDTIDFIFNSIDFTSIQSIDQLVHIILGSIGFFAGIILVVGTYTKVPAKKLKLPIYIMLMGFTFNYFYGIFMLTPLGG